MKTPGFAPAEAPSISCLKISVQFGNFRCEEFCAEVYDAAKVMRLDPAEAIRKTIERELYCSQAEWWMLCPHHSSVSCKPCGLLHTVTESLVLPDAVPHGA